MSTPQQLKNLINANSHLFWFIPDDQKQNLSTEVVLETIFNYGDMNAVKELIRILGISEARTIYYRIFDQSERRKNNFHEITVNFFSEFFEKYAPGNIQS